LFYHFGDGWGAHKKHLQKIAGALQRTGGGEGDKGKDSVKITCKLSSFANR